MWLVIKTGYNCIIAHGHDEILFKTESQEEAQTWASAWEREHPNQWLTITSELFYNSLCQDWLDETNN
jgi:hypothetical protein